MHTLVSAKVAAAADTVQLCLRPAKTKENGANGRRRTTSRRLCPTRRCLLYDHVSSRHATARFSHRSEHWPPIPEEIVGKKEVIQRSHSLTERRGGSSAAL